ncbi:unnamed protein product [Adineta ricciae]|uniref:RING-type domain-containing protein n=1 Tax=Adineta ricciae TaxID=249248 RepID=A0A816BX33_ADIRI|nr:unnamed protein product [Adineta ricciae]
MFDIDNDLWNSPFFGLFPPTSDASSNTLLATCLSHDSSGSSSNGSSTTFSFTDSAYASSSSPPPPLQHQQTNNSTSQSISIMRSLQSQQHSAQQQQQKMQQMLGQPSTHASLLTGLTTSSPSSSLSSVHSITNVDNPCSSSSPFFHKQIQHQDCHYNHWDCPHCQEPYKQTRPKVLQCFHTLCETCVEKLSDNNDASICCPSCGVTTMLNEILPDYTAQNHPESLSNDYMLPFGENATKSCTACKSAESIAIAKCFQCSSFLCHQCVCAHQIMNCFEGHRVSYNHLKE